MKFGLFHTVQWPEGSDQSSQYENALEQAILADQLGYHSVWFTEHHFSRHGITSDPLALLAHLAARTERIRLGTAVSVLPFHDPVRLAESSAIVDHLSGGRLDFGIGRGYQWTEYNGFGMGLDEGTDRFDEALALLLQSWDADEPFAFEGKYHSYSAAFPQPKPLQRPHPPIWHATASTPGLRRCAENDWGILVAQATGLDTISDLMGRYRTELAAAGRDDGAAKVVLARGMYCAPTDEEALDTYLGRYAAFLDQAARVSAPPQPVEGDQPRNPFELDDPDGLRSTILCGSPSTCSRMLLDLVELGVDYVILFVNLGQMEHEAVTTSLELFAREVMPSFAS